jgi:hypothetical protein
VALSAATARIVPDFFAKFGTRRSLRSIAMRVSRQNRGWM